MTNAPDVELIKAAQSGDKQAFEEIFDCLYAQAIGTAYLICGSSCDSEYIVQDAFVKCYEKLGSLKAPEAFRPWFFRILTRAARRYSSKNKREQPVAEVFEEALADAAPTPAELVIERESASELKTAIDGLSNEQKTAVILYYYQDLSVGEIAKILSCREGTVKSRLFNARRNLQKQLSQENLRQRSVMI